MVSANGARKRVIPSTWPTQKAALYRNEVVQITVWDALIVASAFENDASASEPPKRNSSSV